jgi:type I restriction enzyme S subunit
MSKSIDRYIKLQGGFAIKSSDYRESGIPLIRISNVSAGGLDNTNVIFVPKEYACDLKDYLANEEDTLIAMSGATTGKCCLVKKDDLPCLINQRVGRFVINDETEVDKKFVYYIISSHAFQNELLKDAVGGAQPNVSPRQIEKINWDFPLYNQQQKIAKILSTTDTVIEKTQTAIAKYKSIKQGMLNDLFTRGIDIKTGKLRDKQEDAPGLYKESELGWIPKEWDKEILGNISNIEMGQSPDSIYYNTANQGLPLIQGNADIKERKSIQRIWTSQVTKYIDAGDIIMTVRAPVGLIGIASQPSCAGRGICAFKTSNINSMYLFYLLIFH